MTLGQFPALTLIEARRQAIEVMSGVLQGGADPWAVRKKTSEERYTNAFESVAAQFIAKKKDEIKSWAKVEKAFELHVAPKWKGLSILDLGRAEARQLIDGIKSRGTAREVRKHLHALFEWAVDEEIVAKNPLRERKGKGGKKKSRLARNKDAGRSPSCLF